MPHFEKIEKHHFSKQFLKNENNQQKKVVYIGLVGCLI